MWGSRSSVTTSTNSSRLSDQLQEILLTIDGAADVAGEQITGQPTLEIRLKQDQLARHGIPGSDVLEFIEAVGSRPVGEIIEGQRRFPLVVRLPDELRTDVGALASTTVPTRAGPLLALRSLADIEETEGPATINREWGRRLIKVQCNVRGRDVASFVEEARDRIDSEIDCLKATSSSGAGSSNISNAQSSGLRSSSRSP